MKKKNVIAIIGRPNVGKSSLFNRVIKEKKAIIEDRPGVTRDRIYGSADWLTRDFIVIDTGGITLENATFAKEIKLQAEIAMAEADVIVFVVNHQEGLLPDDEMIAKLLYKTKKPVILAVNKYDRKMNQDETYHYLTLGFGEPFLISSTHGIGIGDLLDEIIHKLPSPKEQDQTPYPSVALIGKPNVGKSSLINTLTGEQRMIVSPIPGTTIDAVDSLVKYNGKNYLFVDTAGIRRKGKIESLEKYSYLRSLGAINKADFVLLMMDMSEPISDQDTNIGGLAFEAQKPIIIIGNKWDLLPTEMKDRKRREAEIRAYFKYLRYAKIIFISALEKQKIGQIYQAIDDVDASLKRKIQTSIFNEVLNRAQLLNPAPDHNGGRLKIYYGSQVEAYLPTFVIFVNNPDYVHFSYKRFLENQIREQFGFEGVPINLIFRERR
ncbi:GTP-binding protein [Entomoplasma freundtii]|uniref:GTPase Der n=1 Tax=Entomoplasma freundtii TaxID=74700 RepID=A0A2K8NRU0_9MOLU|nr:ribosome biogenesis GTPase Der [Entomoplasma freundtii]ATZ16572.1 GTP-binding protein EngA [Entomoplasma freundtii]TDY58262.1 GTP-binding protein [Entomoplasma freundtii]